MNIRAVNDRFALLLLEDSSPLRQPSLSDLVNTGLVLHVWSV